MFWLINVTIVAHCTAHKVFAFLAQLVGFISPFTRQQSHLYCTFTAPTSHWRFLEQVTFLCEICLIILQHRFIWRESLENNSDSICVLRLRESFQLKNSNSAGTGRGDFSRIEGTKLLLTQNNIVCFSFVWSTSIFFAWLLPETAIFRSGRPPWFLQVDEIFVSQHEFLPQNVCS